MYTVDAARSWARTVAVRDGRIVYVGTDGPAAELIGPQTEVVSLAGRMVLPGFQDAHVHPVSSGAELTDVMLYDVPTPAAAADTIRAYAAAHPQSKWIRGAGWQLPLFPHANPSRALLDSAVPDRPALLYAADGHSAWVNSRALALAGSPATRRDPPNGRIERDPDGDPSGTLAGRRHRPRGGQPAPIERKPSSRPASRARRRRPTVSASPRSSAPMKAKPSSRRTRPPTRPARSRSGSIAALATDGDTVSRTLPAAPP